MWSWVGTSETQALVGLAQRPKGGWRATMVVTTLPLTVAAERDQPKAGHGPQH